MARQPGPNADDALHLRPQPGVVLAVQPRRDRLPFLTAVVDAHLARPRRVLADFIRFALQRRAVQPLALHVPNERPLQVRVPQIAEQELIVGVHPVQHRLQRGAPPARRQPVGPEVEQRSAPLVPLRIEIRRLPESLGAVRQVGVGRVARRPVARLPSDHAPENRLAARLDRQLHRRCRLQRVVRVPPNLVYLLRRQVAQRHVPALPVDESRQKQLAKNFTVLREPQRQPLGKSVLRMLPEPLDRAL